MNKTSQKPLTPKSYMMLLSLIHAVLLLGILLFGAVIYVQGGELITGFSDKSDVFIYIVPLLAMIAYFGGDFMFSKLLSSINRENSLKQKLNKYLQASIIRFAFLEGASFIGVFAYMQNNNVFYLVITVVLILYLIKIRPTKEKVVRDLRLTRKEEERFKTPDGEL